MAKKKKRSFSSLLMMVFGFLTAVVFLPTTVLLLVGMLPTLVAGLISRTGTKALTVGAMNLAGCSPFLLELWTIDHSVDRTLSMVTEPRTIVVIYAAAAIGYLLDWAVAGVVKTFVYQRGKARVKEIEKQKENMRERWGREVVGDIPLDAYGFPIEKDGAA